jgi:hypothetical protein
MVKKANQEVYKRLSIVIILIEAIFIVMMALGAYSYFTEKNLDSLLQPIKIIGWIYGALFIIGWWILRKGKISLVSIMSDTKSLLSKSILSGGLYLVVAFPTNLIILFTAGEVDWLLPLNAAIATPFILTSLIITIIFYLREI